MLALALIVALAIVPSCSRNKDPYEDWKAPRMLEEGDRLLRANDLPNAEIVFRKGLAKAEKAGFSADKSRIFVTRLAYIAAAREDIAEAQKLFERMGDASSPTAMDPRVTLHLAVLLRRAGKNDEARAIAEKLAVRLAARPPANPDELPFYAVGWIAIDRLRTENVEPGRAREATAAFTERFKSFAEERRPISAALRGWLTRYLDHLFDNDRSLAAQEVGDLVERVDQMAPSPADKQACIPLDANFAALGCLADWPEK